MDHMKSLNNNERILFRKAGRIKFRELFEHYNVDKDHLYYIMHKMPEAIKFKKGDHVLYMGYTHLRPNQSEFIVYEVVKINLDALTDVTIKPLTGGDTQRVYHRDLVKINK